MENVIIAAFAAALIVSTIDYWTDLGIARVLVSVVVSGLALWSIGGYSSYWWVTSSLAAGFLGIAVIQIMERVSRITVNSRSRL